MHKRHLMVLVFLIALGIIASGCAEKSDSSSEDAPETTPASASEATITTENIPEASTSGTLAFTASDVVEIHSGQASPELVVYNPNTGGALYYIGPIANIEKMSYEGTGFFITTSSDPISHYSMTVLPKTSDLKVTSVRIYGREGRIETSERNIYERNGIQGVVISSRNPFYNEIERMKISFRPT